MSARPRHKALPIAAHLAALVALAVTGALAAALTIVLLLPPRPPEVVRADLLIDSFKSAYTTAKSGDTPAATSTLRFRIEEAPSSRRAGRGARPLSLILARTLSLRPEDVRISAREEQRDLFVFRVQSAHRMDVRREEMAVQIDRFGLRPEGRGAPDLPPPPNAIPSAPTVDTPAPQSPPSQTVVPPAPPAPPMPPPMFAPAPPGVMLVSGFEVAAKLPTGRWLVMEQVRAAEFDWIVRVAGAFAITLLLMAGLALLFARQLARPIQGFARAVQGVGVDPHHAPVALTGPRELRDAADAINAMQTRLRTLIGDRTKTLATVAHDMRTPLMRMRLTAESAPDDVRDKLGKDIADVEALVASFIAFARDDPAEEARTRLDLAALVESLVADQVAAKKNATYEGPDRLIIVGQPLGLKRLFDNLIDNAIKYGGHADVRLYTEGSTVVADVRDNGPGVPPALKEDIFKPFVRAVSEASGAGLGLAAARSIARAHGGDIRLVDGDKGALFRVTLPG